MVVVTFSAQTLILIATLRVAAINNIIAMIDVGFGSHTLAAVGSIITIHLVIVMVDIHFNAHALFAILVSRIVAIHHICRSGRRHTQYTI